MATKQAHSSQKQTTEGQKTGYVVNQLKQEMEKCFSEQTESKPSIEVPMSELPRVCNPKELSEARKIYLRSAAQTITSNTVELNQFDPNFFSRANIWCRSPGCKQKKPRSIGTKKEDLYLCLSHKKTLEEHLVKICKEKGVEVSMTCRGEDFEGYTSLIGMLESAFNSMSKPMAHLSLRFKKTSQMVQDVCLNMRNFLIIVNALLNPKWENIVSALTSSMTILMEFLRMLAQPDGEVIIQRMRELLDLLRIVMEEILFAFGVIYSWIYLSLIGNPGAQLGAGIGGFVGMAGMMGGPAIGTLTAMGGAFFGGLIGSGVYNIWYAGQGNTQAADNERIRRYQEFAQANQRVIQAADLGNQLRAVPGPPAEECVVYYLTGSATGDLIMLAMLCYGIGIPVI